MSKDSQIQKLGKLTVGELFARFPDENACLNHIMEVRYGLRHVCAACGVEGTFHKLAMPRASSCAINSRNWPIFNAFASVSISESRQIHAYIVAHKAQRRTPGWTRTRVAALTPDGRGQEGRAPLCSVRGLYRASKVRLMVHVRLILSLRVFWGSPALSRATGLPKI